MSILNSGKVISGASWMMAANVSSVLLKFVTIPILARMLTPEDFGVVALGMTIVIFLSFLGGKGGLSAALIAKQIRLGLCWNSALLANIVIGLIFALCMFAFSQPLSIFLGSPEAELYIRVLSLLIPIQFAVDILNSRLLAKHRFKTEAGVNTFADVVAGVISLGAAYNGAGAWALVLQHFLAQLFRLLLLLNLNKVWIKLQFSYLELKKLLGFSMTSIGVEIANYMSFYAPVVIASKYIGVSASGALSVQGRLAALPGDIILQGISKVLLPMFSNNRLTENSLKDGLIWSVWVNSILLTPILVGLGVLAEHITIFLLGEQYINYWFVLACLALSRALMIPCASFNPYLKAIGKIQALLILFTFRALLVVIGGIVLSSMYGLIGLMWAIVISSIISLIVYTPVTSSVSGIPFRKLILAFLPVFISASIMGAVVFYFISEVSFSNNAELLLSILIGGAVYCLSLFIFYEQLRNVRSLQQLKIFFSNSPSIIR